MNASVLSVAAFDPFARGSVETIALFGSRMTGLVLITPTLSSTIVPRAIRVAIVIVLTVLLQPVALASVSGVPRLTPTAILGEVLVGFAIGLGSAIIIGAAEAAGDVMAVQIGLSGAAIMDPLNAAQTEVLGVFSRLLAITLLLTLNLHIVLLGALADSTRAFPVGAPLSLVAGVGSAIQLGGTVFALGARFAAPVIAAVLLTNVALAVLGRAAPQLNVLWVSFPVQIAVGLLALIAALPAIGRFLAGWAGVYDGMLDHIVRGFTAVAAH
jgi:flagellar biosynthetic protein FliR